MVKSSEKFCILWISIVNRETNTFEPLFQFLFFAGFHEDKFRFIKFFGSIIFHNVNANINLYSCFVEDVHVLLFREFGYIAAVHLERLKWLTEIDQFSALVEIGDEVFQSRNL
jgi:hypothetical protein